MGKSSGSAKTPSIAADNLESKQQLSIIDILGEGQIEGPVGGLKGVYLNKTPIEAADGSYNFNGVEVEWVAGTQAQEPLSGFSETQNEVPVSLEVKYSTPIVRTITDPNIDRIRITAGVSALYAQTNSGDVVRTSVKMAVQIGSGNNWTTKKTIELNDKKTRSQYLTSVILDDLPAVPFNIRVTRITPDSTSDLLVNGTLWSSYTEIYDVKLAYPNTALVGLRFDSSQFNGVPSRTYLVKGIMCQVPDNYDSISRSYSGIWLGEFKTEWTDNPAWIFYDLMTNDRYGMASRFGGFPIDKFTLYSIAQYCDEMVDDGFGGKEPRFTCNCNITEQEQAYDLIAKFCSIFRALPVWDGLQLTAVIDRPSDTVAVYTNANVVDGKFNYSSAAMKDRHTAARVKYVDPDYSYETVTEYVADDDLIKRFGLNVSDVEGFGCTSRGQAHRVGKWLIATEKYERQTVNFSVGREGLRHLPGDIIEVLDNDYAGVQSGGRIKSAEGKIIALDRDVEIGTNSYITYQDMNANLVKVKVSSQKSANTVVVDEDVNADEWSTWILTNNEVSSRLFKAIAITENDDLSLSVTALEHNPAKESIVDEGAAFTPDPNQSLNWAIPAIESLAVSVTPDSDLYQAVLTWSTPRTMSNLEFQVTILRNGNLVSRQTVPEMSVTMNNIDDGNYTASVRGISTEDGRLGDESIVTFTIAAPSTPAQLAFAVTSNSVTIKPLMPSSVGLGTTFEYYKGTTLAEVQAMTNYLGRTSNSLIDADVLASTTYYYGVVAVNAAGRSGLRTGSVTTESDSVGTAGGIFRIKTSDGVFPVNSDDATELFYNVLGMYPSQDTVLIVYSADVDNNITHSEQKMYNGSMWVTPALFLDGDLIATGTISGDRLVAYTEIKAPVITGGTININDRFIVDKDGTTTIKSGDAGGRLVINNETITVYDESGKKKIEIGRLYDQ
ncbi:host specificity protein J [Orbus mooreae]|uniref:host specificity protein J n=1 Tax=Orbus mooreae TaxID=3074107 RepID=UPI00370DD480